MNKYLLIGEVLKPQGVKGDVKVRPITCDIFRFEDLEEVFFVKDGEYAPWFVVVDNRHYASY